MAVQDIEILLADARLVAEYASKAGLLPDMALPQAIDAVEKAVAAGQPAEIAPLLAAFNQVMKAISPYISLLDLHAGLSPFDARNRSRKKSNTIFFAVLSIVLAGLIADTTWDLHSDSSLLKSIQEIENARHPEKIGMLRKMVQQDEALKNPRSQKYSEYQRAYRELSELNEKIRLTLLQAQKFGARSPVPSDDNFKAMSQRIRRWLVSDSSGQANVKSIPPPEKSPSAGIEEKTGKGDAATANLAGSDVCSPPGALLASLKGRVYLQEAIREAYEEYCFPQQLNLLVPGYSAGHMASAISDVQVEVYRKSSWILPFIGGLLGAAVFLMRFFLTNTLRPFPEWHDGLLRIALGGIAGIIIGWFKWPSGPEAPDLAAISSVPFGLAFLAGYSIDIVFSLLERLNRLISEPKKPEPA